MRAGTAQKFMRLVFATARYRRPKNFPLPAGFIMGTVLLLAVIAPWVSPYSPTDATIANALLPPFWDDGGKMEYLLGTDRLGRDILSRLIYGARISISVSLAAILVGGGIGTFLGLMAGYLGRWTDDIIMRLADLALSLPVILVALVLAIVIGPSLMNVILVISILIWARYARQVRGEVLSIKEQDFVLLAQIAGCTRRTIIWRHVLPNAVNTLIVLATLQVGWVILLEGSLSFLGVGVPPPQPSWGSMVADGRDFLASAWWLSTLPGIAMLLTVLSVNMLGDWLRDAFDPKLRQI